MLTWRERAALEAYWFEYRGESTKCEAWVAIAKYKPGLFGEKTVKALAGRGLLETGPDHRDARNTGYKISESGIRAIGRAPKVRQAISDA